MPSDGGTLVREWAQRWSAHDVEGLAALFADDGIYEDVALGHAFSGRADIAEFIRSTFVTFPDFRVEIVECDGGERMQAGEWEMSGTFLGESFGTPPTGKSFRVPGACVMYVRDGLITLHRDYWNPLIFDAQVNPDSADTPAEAN